MGKRAWLNVILLALIVALAAVVYYEPGIEHPVVQPLTQLRVESIDALKVAAPDQTPAILKREGQRWFLTSPKHILANPVRIQRILEMLTASSEQQYSAGGLDLKKYGLVPPKAKLEVGGTVITFGDLDPLNSRRYVLIGQTLHLIDQNDISVLTGDWPSLVDLRLFPEERELSMIEISDMGKLVRSDKGWEFKGKGKRPDQRMIETLVGAWRDAQAMEVAADETESTGEYAILKFSDGGELRFDVNRFADQVVLGRADLEIEYHFTTTQAQRLLEFEKPASTASANKTESSMAQ